MCGMEAEARSEAVSSWAVRTPIAGWFMRENPMLVGGSATPLKNMNSSLGRISNPILMGKCQKWQPNHQPAWNWMIWFGGNPICGNPQMMRWQPIIDVHRCSWHIRWSLCLLVEVPKGKVWVSELKINRCFWSTSCCYNIFPSLRHSIFSRFFQAVGSSERSVQQPANQVKLNPSLWGGHKLQVWTI